MSTDNETETTSNMEKLTAFLESVGLGSTWAKVLAAAVIAAAAAYTATLTSCDSVVLPDSISIATDNATYTATTDEEGNTALYVELPDTLSVDTAAGTATVVKNEDGTTSIVLDQTTATGTDEVETEE